MTKATAEKIEETPLALGAARIRELRRELARLGHERSRIAALSGNAQGHADEIEQLRQQRAEALATALVDGDGPADVGELDAHIAAAESAAREALAAGKVAIDALNVIEARRAAIADALAEATEAQLELAARDLLRRREEQYDEFNAAANALRGPLERMLSVERLLIEIRRRQSKGSASGVGTAHNLLDALRDQGLRVLREHDHAIWPCGWLSWRELTAGSPAFTARYLANAGLD